MRIAILGLAFFGLLSGCADQASTDSARGVARIDAARASADDVRVQAPTGTPARFASLPDRGELVHYDRLQPPVTRSAYTWHPIAISEAHALQAVAGGELVVAAPDGRPIRLQYQRHVEHPDGNWTWIGREPGADPGTEAIITFGPEAVFGSIPDDHGPPLRLTSASGRAWLVATDPVALARLDSRAAHPREPDFRLPPRLSLPASAARPAATAAGAATTGGITTVATTTVDLLLGYTSGFAASLGGQSQALTRLTYLVAVTNQAYVNSQVDLRVRLVRAAQVNYPDNTSNEDALYDLTGVQCTPQAGGGQSCTYVGPVAALQPLHAARDQYGADLVSLVRDFNEPENEGCGLAWINGGGQVALTPDDEITGLSVVGDGVDPANDGTGRSYFCRDETLAHELGHNMGSAHDRDTADGEDNVLQANEYGRYSYSFGYKSAGFNFHTVMAYGDEGQTPYRVFSNPAISYCGGQPCGVANQADNARSLRQTTPTVAAFRATLVPETGTAHSDFNGDGVSDVLWRHATTGSDAIWLSANKATQQATTRISNLAWRMVGIGDIDADGRADIVWRNTSTGANTIWRSGRSSTTRSMAGVTSQSWQVAGVGDFNGDGADDVLWRNSATGANTIWKSANKATQQAMTTISSQQWQIVGVGDLNADGRDDVVWRNAATGGNAVWWSGNYATRRNLTTVSNAAWKIVGVGDFNGDGADDLLWRNSSTGANTIWKGGSASSVQAMSRVSNLSWRVEGTGDFDGNGVDDVLWRNHGTGANTIWRSARASTVKPMATITSQSWQIQP